jgi:hypothetical protein
MPEEMETGVKNESLETPSNDNGAEENQTNSSGQGSTSDSSSMGDVKPQPKTYTEEEINQILHERTKSYSEKIKQYEEKLKAASGEPKDPMSNLSAEDKKFIEYLKKIQPYIGQPSLKEEDLKFVELLRQREQAETNNFLSEGDKVVKGLASELKITDNRIEVLKDAIASIILSDDSLKSRLVRRDVSVFKDAFGVFKSTFQPVISNAAKSEVSKVVKAKENVANVKQPVKGGISAPLTKKDKMTHEEFLEAAFKRIKGE